MTEQVKEIRRERDRLQSDIAVRIREFEEWSGLQVRRVVYSPTTHIYAGSVPPMVGREVSTIEGCVTVELEQL